MAFRTASRANPSRIRRPTSKTVSLAAPIKGWNAKDSITELDPLEAEILVNWFPKPGELTTRKGHTSHAVLASAGFATDSLMAWNGIAGSSILWAATTSALWNVTAETSAGDPTVTSVTNMTNGRWQHTNFGTAGGDFLVMCNGDDSVRNFDGTNWTTPTINVKGSAHVASDFIHVSGFKQRLFFIPKASMDLYYLPVNSIAGSATPFPIHSFTRKGGHLVASGSLTIDGGAGSDDLFCLISSEGEVLIYQGTDIDFADSWTLVGRYNIGPPVGRRCMTKFSGDLIVITKDGYESLREAVQAGRANPSGALSDKIRGAVNEAMQSFSDNFGWEALLYPKGSMAIFNVPLINNTKIEQHVFNLTTKAWCKFSGMNANTWEVMQDKLYFGGSSEIFLADNGESDGDSNIETDVQQAFSNFGSPGRTKHFKWVRPILRSDGIVTPAIKMNVDYKQEQPTSISTTTLSSDSLWGETGQDQVVSMWDVTPWASGPAIQRNWQNADGVGEVGGLRMQSSHDKVSISWVATDYLFEEGGVL